MAISAVAAVGVGAGLYSSGKNRKDAKKARKSGDAKSDAQLELANREFDFQKSEALDQKQYARGVYQNNRAYTRGLTAENRGLADSDYQRRLSEADAMMSDAKFSEGDYARELGASTAAVRDQFGKNLSEVRRGLGRFGGAGGNRYASIEKDFGLNQAIAEANAQNQTRREMSREERSATRTARGAGINISRQIIGPGGQPGAAPNPAINVSNGAIPVLGAASRQDYNYAAGRNSAATSSLSNSIQAGLTMYGMRNSTPSAPSPSPSPAPSSSPYSFSGSDLNLSMFNRS